MKKRQRRIPWGWLAAAVIVVALGAYAIYVFEPMADWTGLFLEWVEENGALGVLIFIAGYVVATLLLLPSAVFNVAAGALFGLAWGVGAVMAGSMTAAVIAFLLARHALRERISRYYSRKGTAAAVDRALRSEGWKAVALVRLSPVIPFAVKNYLFGCSRVRMRDYLVGTFLGKLPGAIVLAALGATGRAAWDMPAGEKWTLMAVGLAATVAVTWLIGRTAKRRLGLA